MPARTALLLLVACLALAVVALRHGVLLLIFPASALAVVLAAIRTTRRRTAALFAHAGLSGHPKGKRMILGGVYRPTRIAADAYVALGPSAPPPGNRRSEPRAMHLWIVFPEPFPMVFRFTAGSNEESVMEGDFPDMAELLASPAAEERVHALLAALAPLSGRLTLDEKQLRLDLPPKTMPTQELTNTALELWRVIREGSGYPFHAR